MEKIRWVLPQLRATGITSFFEANTDGDTVAAFAELARRNELAARVTIALETDGDDNPEEFARLNALRDEVKGLPLLRADFVKLFADGVLEYPTQTAGLLTPYLDGHGKPTKSGSLYLPSAQMQAFIADADRNGYNVHVHAIGDAAVRETLDAFEAARGAGNKRLFSIAHLQLIDPADLPRFAKNDVIASFQLLWAQPDNYSVDAVEKYIGPERMARQYPARSLKAAGGVIAGGSDWDVSSFNPFEAMATAMSRKNPAYPERAALVPAESLTLDDMLVAYTRNAARMMGRADEIGTLAPGMAADFIVLDRTLTSETSADDVRVTRPTRVFFAGRDVTPK
jgi:predicted amidohydrolase YtcJ